MQRLKSVLLKFSFYRAYLHRRQASREGCHEGMGVCSLGSQQVTEDMSIHTAEINNAHNAVGSSGQLSIPLLGTGPTEAQLRRCVVRVVA
jgi:hypothetical protein